MGDSMADWLAYGLEDAFSDSPEVAIIRKNKIHSGLLRYETKGDLDWWHVARDILAQEKPNYVVMMLGVSDRQNIRERDLAKEAEKKKAEDEQADQNGAEPKDNPTAPISRRSLRPSRSKAEKPTGRSNFAASYGRRSTRSASTKRSRPSRARACRCSGSACRRSAARARPPTRSISTISIARAPSAPASSISTCGMASWTRPASTRTSVRTMKARCAGCVRATASISPSPAPASSRTMSSVKYAAI